MPIKSELIREVQERHRVAAVFKAISEQWRMVVEAIRDAETLVVVGYGFPPEDQYGQFLIKEGLRLRHSKLKVVLFERWENTAETARRIASCFGKWIDSLRLRGPAKPF